MAASTPLPPSRLHALPQSPTTPQLTSAALLANTEPPTLSPKTSTYTLRTLPRPPSEHHSEVESLFNDTEDESAPTPTTYTAPLEPDPPPTNQQHLLLATSTRDYGAVSSSQPEASTSTLLDPPADPPERRPWWKRPLVHSVLLVALIFLLSGLVLGGTLYFALPRIAPQDKPLLRLPKNFQDLKGLNSLLKKYRKQHPYRVVICWVTTYLFVQAFPIPGSMYLSILGGAMWGVPLTVPLICFCVATGSSLGYLVSAAFGPALLSLPKWKLRIDTFADKVDAQRANLFSYLILLRLSPIPPHWVVNVICPHVRISLLLFWATTFLGIFGVAVIHTSIGGRGLDQMISADDFHLVSWKNALTLGGVAVAALIPIIVKRVWRVEDVETVAQTCDVDSSSKV